MNKRAINYEEWSRSLIGFIRQKGLEQEFKDWCGGWPCPIASALPNEASVLADEIEQSDGLILMKPGGGTVQLGIRKSAIVVAAIRSLSPVDTGRAPYATAYNAPLYDKADNSSDGEAAAPLKILATDETGWLIEKDDPPVYHQLLFDDDWTPDVEKALRFARREDAQAYVDHTGWTSPPVRVVEHMWPLRAAPASSPHDGVRALLAACDFSIGALKMLQTAIDCGDPKRELTIRINEIEMKLRAALAKIRGKE